jgi:hypothetical protein
MKTLWDSLYLQNFELLNFSGIFEPRAGHLNAYLRLRPYIMWVKYFVMEFLKGIVQIKQGWKRSPQPRVASESVSTTRRLSLFLLSRSPDKGSKPERNDGVIKTRHP